MDKIFEDQFSSQRVKDDFWEFLAREHLLHGEGAACEVDGLNFSISRQTEIEITTRVLQLNYHPGHSSVRVVIAVGGLRSEANGVLEAVYFFAKLYYSGVLSSWHVTRVDFDTCESAL